MATIVLDLLGGFDIRRDDGAAISLPAQKNRALLGFLATTTGRSHSRDALVALLWDELPREQARGALRQALWALRRTVNDDATTALVVDGDAVTLDPGAVRVDVADFVLATSRSDPESLARAAALYRGDLLAGLSAREAPFEDWLAAERERLAHLALSTLTRLLAHQRAAGALDEAVQTAVRLLALDPLQEGVHRSLMRLYLQLGRRGAALRQYQSCVGILQRELGVEPDAATRTLYQDILRWRPADDHGRDGNTSAPPPAAPIAPAPTAADPDTPLIGREREMATLRDALADACAGRGRVVAVVGEAGIGKTRLIGELLAQASARGARVLVGRAYESDQVLALGPWADALRHVPRIDDLRRLPPAQSAWLAEITGIRSDLARPEPTVPRGTYDYAQLFESVVRLVTGLATPVPLVIALEDLHWADDMSLRLVAFLARRAHGHIPLLLLVTAREEQLDAASPARRMLDDLDRDLPRPTLTLPPLARAPTLDLVRILTGGRHSTLFERCGERICAASEGHPFVVVEMVRALGEDTEGETPGGVALPQRVRRLVERRFEHLSASAQHFMQTAAVTGRDFEYALLERASGLEEDVAVAALEELVRRRVFQAIGERFEFAHDRLREVAYALLLPPRRKLLHRRVAEALERIHASDLTPCLAALGTHYAEAEVWEPAVRRLYQAAQWAYDRTAYREGVVLLERALAALARLPRTRDALLLEIDVRLRLFRCLNPFRDPSAADQVARAQALAVEAPDEAREAVILVEVAELRRYARDIQAGIDAAERALVLAARTDQPRLLAPAHFQLGVAHFTRGAYRDGIAHLRLAVARLADAPLRDRLGYPYIPALSRLSWSLIDLGEIGAAWRHAEEARRLAETTEHVMTVAETSTLIGMLHLAGDRPADAISPLERASALGRAWPIEYILSFSLSWLALAYARCGRRDQARSALEECERERMWERVRLQWSRIVVRLGQAHLLLGEPAPARALAERGLELARTIGEPAGEAEALALLAEVAPLEGADGEAELHLDAAVTIARRLGLAPLLARVDALRAATQARSA